MVRVADGYNPAEPYAPVVELRSLSAPVFGGDGSVAFTFTLWGPKEPVRPETVDEHVAALTERAGAATRAIGGSRRRGRG